MNARLVAQAMALAARSRDEWPATWTPEQVQHSIEIHEQLAWKNSTSDPGLYDAHRAHVAALGTAFGR